MKNYFTLILTSSALILSLLIVQPALAVVAEQQLNVPQGSASLNWSGYVSEGQGNYTSVAGTWVVPQVSANTSGTADATWVGIGGVVSHDLIQAGTQAIVEDGTITYSAWVETLPNYSQNISLEVKPGDSVTATLTEESTGVWGITLTNNTTGKSYSTVRTYASTLSSAEWVEEMVSNPSGSFRPLDSFGTVSFINASATVNGTSQNLQQLNAQPLHMINNAGQRLATASSLNGDSTSFTVARSDTPAILAAERTRPLVVMFVRPGHRGGGNTITLGGFTFTIVRL